MKRVFAVIGVFLGMSLLWAEPSIWRHAECGGVDEVKAYLDAGNQVDAPDANGWTLLHHAAYGASGKMIRFLLSKGADVNKKITPNGYKHGPIVSDFCWEWKYFGSDSAGVTAYTPLHLALMNLKNSGTSVSIKLLLDAGADITVPMQFNGFGPKKMVDSPMSVMEFALTRFTFGMAGPDQVKAVKMLYQANAKLTKKKQIKITKNMALSEAYLITENDLAVILDDTKKVKTLIKKKSITPQLINNTIIADSPAVLKAMINAKIIDKNPKTGYDLLLLAAQQNSMGVIKVLIDNGVDPNFVPIFTNSADPMAGKYMEAGIDTSPGTPVMYYAVFDCTDTVMAEYLISKGATVTNPMYLEKAVRENRFALVKLFLEKGAKVNLTDLFMTEVVRWNNAESAPIIDYLIQQGGNVNAVDPYDNMSLLQLAEQRENQAIIDVLIKNGAK